ncbi:MAG TPA: S1 RNA-binding domain-containing protein [Elusimicrobiota bacterium]|nr:S1 RNA-binding domain-containing protein [Elusimicrobiota bacterium]
MNDHDQTEDDFSALLDDSLGAAEKTYAAGDRVRAEILALGHEDAIVALGPGKEGVVAAKELAGRAAGESVDLFVTSVRPSEIRLSVNPTDKNIAQDLKEAYESRRPVEGRVAEVCKGGVRVSVRGKSAFCPISQLDLKRVETGAEFVGKTLVFRITEWGEEGRNVVVSRRKLLEEEQAIAVAEFLAKNPDGSIAPGKVSRLEKFGAFIELLPGVEGLAHISELAWSRVESPADLLTVGQSVAVKILKRETVEGRLKIALSLKQATEKPAAAPAVPVVDPWAKYAAGQVLEGKITRKEPYGLFVQLEPGVVGLLHQSKTADRAEFRLESRKVGETIAVEIGEVKLAERRISLQLPRDADADEWRKRQESAEAAPSAMAETLRAALQKKNR